MTEKEGRQLDEISEMLSMLNDVIDAMIRVMGNPDPDSDDIAFLEAFANGALSDKDEEWIDESWDEAMALLPVRTLYIRKPGDPWVK